MSLDVARAGGPASGPGAMLRRHRVEIALVIAVVELIALWLGGASRFSLLALAIAGVALHHLAGRRQSNYVVRQLTWIIAFSQVAAAIAWLALKLVFGVIVVIAVVVLVGALVVLAGDRT